jgi:hypothetical protein
MTGVVLMGAYHYNNVERVEAVWVDAVIRASSIFVAHYAERILAASSWLTCMYYRGHSSHSCSNVPRPPRHLEPYPLCLQTAESSVDGKFPRPKVFNSLGSSYAM